MKRLYNENDTFSDECYELDTEVINALKPIFKKWSEKGYSMREVSHVAQGSVFHLEVRLMAKSRKK